MRVVALVVLALVLAPAAAAGNIATPKMTAIASWAAGKPVVVWCEEDLNDWQTIRATYGLSPSGGVSGFTSYEGNTVWISPDGCYALTHPEHHLFGPALATLLHEAAHQRGFRDEALAECAGLVFMYSALHDFYGVPWFSARMHAVTEIALEYARSLPPAYQGGCARI